jgi:pSer/pThr/pTyr-binding forkhead associated (FHA) protein
MKIRKYTIGRSYDNDEVIDEPDVSAHHAMIYVIDNVVSIDDLDSSNGTYHNGYRIKTTILQRNSEVKIANRYKVNLAPFFEDYNSDFQLDADNNYVRQFDELEEVWNKKEEKMVKLERKKKINDFTTRTAFFVIPCLTVSIFWNSYYVIFSLIMAPISNIVSFGRKELKKKQKEIDIQFKKRYKCPRCGIQLHDDWHLLKEQKECVHCKAVWVL